MGDDEAGIDQGGLARDWFDSVGRALVEGVGNARGNSLLRVAVDKNLMPRKTPANLARPQKRRFVDRMRAAKRQRLHAIDVVQHVAEPGGVVSVGATSDRTHDSQGGVGALNERAMEQRGSELISLGRFLGLAVYHRSSLPLSFSLTWCKLALNIPLSMEDVWRADQEFHR